MDRSINIVKIGGNVIDNPEALDAFLDEFAARPGMKILVHGGGKEATRLSARLGIETTMIGGRRVTDLPTLRLVTAVYAGLLNKDIVARLQARGCNAVGLSGADANILPAVRRPAAPVDYGYVGDIDPERVNAAFIGTLLECGVVPVFCAICHDEHGTLLNCNADSIAAAVAKGAHRAFSEAAPKSAPKVCAKGVRQLVNLQYIFEKPGVLADAEDDASVIEHITAESFEQLKRHGIVSKGMLPKIENALECVRYGVDSVNIGNTRITL